MFGYFHCESLLNFEQVLILLSRNNYKVVSSFGPSLSIVTSCFCFFEPNVTKSSNLISPCFHLIGDPLYHDVSVSHSIFFCTATHLCYHPHFGCTRFGSYSYEFKFFKCCKCTYLCHLSISELMICPFSMYI